MQVTERVQTMKDTYSHTSWKRLAYLDLDGSSWKMSGGHLTLGFKEVLQGLAEQGYDAKWRVVRWRMSERLMQEQDYSLLLTPTATQGEFHYRMKRLPTPMTTDATGASKADMRRNSPPLRSLLATPTTNISHTTGKCRNWGADLLHDVKMHLQAIPNVLDKDGKLNAPFVEYMMGLPPGWVTETGLSRAQQLKMLGNGVVPQQAEYALELLCS